MKMRKLFPTLIMAVLMMPAGAQNVVMPQSDQRLYDEACTLFGRGDYVAARGFLDKWSSSVSAKTQSAIRAEEVEYMQTVCTARTDPYGAPDVIDAFLKKYPNTSHRNRLAALKGSACYLKGDYAQALDWFYECEVDYLPPSERDRTMLHQAISNIKSGDSKQGYMLLTVLSVTGDESIREQTLFYMAYVDYAEGRYDQAAVEFERCLEDPVLNEEASLYLAEIKMRQGDYAAAGEAAKKLAENAVNHTVRSEAERIMGEALYAQKDWRQADELLTSYVTSAENPRRLDLYELGMANYWQRDYKRAVQYLEKAADGRDELAQSAWLHMGLAALEMDDKRQASMAFGQAADCDFNDALTEQAMFNYAMSIDETSFSPFAETVQALDRFLTRFPDSEYADQANSYLADAYMHTNSYEAALASIEKVRYPNTQTMKNKQMLLYRKGVELYAAQRYEEALKDLTQVVDLANYDRQCAAEGAFWRGECNYRLGRWSDAAQDYRRYLAMSTDYSNQNYSLSQYGLGYSAYQQGDYGTALTEWNQLIRQAPVMNVPQGVLADAYLRAADCYFYDHSYSLAYDNYRKAQELNVEDVDYALYQMGLTKGLLKDYRGEVEHMSYLATAYPQSPYAAMALYAQGRAYLQMEQSSNAVTVFEKIVSGYPETELARKASAEIALVYYQNDDYAKAVSSYKYVIETYPGSEEAKLAMKDLKSVYVDMGDPAAYISYSDGVADAAPMNVNERDSLTYAAAEMRFTRGEKAPALKAFDDYLAQYPDGNYAPNAYYYRGLVSQDMSDYDTALSSYLHAAGYQNSRFAEISLERASDMAYSQGDFETAMDTYIRYYNKVGSVDKIRKALLGIERSAYRIEEYDAVLQYADKTLQSGITDDQKTEVNFYKAKGLLATDRGSEAQPILAALSSETRTSYGAESDYLLSQLYFDQGEAAKAEANINELIKGGTPQSYWLARSFVLLSDIFAADGRKIEARQYLLSLQQSYKVQDDVQQMIEDRLARLQ